MAASLDEMLPPPMTYNGRDSFFRGNRAFYNFYNDYSHISDPNLRRRLALSEIDKVPFGLYRTLFPGGWHPCLQGIGIGGDYPLSSVITSEFAPTRWRGAMMSAVFSMQGLGHLMSGVVALITTVAFKSSFIRVPNEASCDADCRIAADRAWRIIVGVGAIPACLAMYYRITIPETPRYTFDIQHDVEKADADIKAYVSSKPTGECEGRRHSRSKVSENSLNLPRASWSDFLAYFGEWKNSSNHGIVLHAIGYGSGSSIYEKLWNNAMGTIVLTAAGSLPGYWTAVFTIDTIGRKPLQIFGFLLLTIVFSVLGFQFHHLSERALLALYIVAQFLFNAGPNTTTFVVPGECFPTRYRSSGHGLSAAFGKIGAILAQTISIPLLKDSGAVFECAGDTCSPYLDRLLKLFALFMFLGTCVSLLIPETKGITLEELSGESRTSYNAGCNGSISMGSPQMHSWNPLHGGQAAGFAYPRVRGAAPFGKGRQSPRVSAVTTSPELLAENSRQKSSRFWRRNSRTRMKSDRSNEIALRNRGSDISLDGQSMTQEQLQLPTWGAGWGRIDRGAPTPKISSVQLNDVGMLLRPN
ncbi:hypothetical protein UVI_02059280 [Ustilaginoidea virens]|uniref:Major facilitator superfamily (MFS) profile domain-containing protein n=1 Tax=Ustilaginoidea virens TaxID=1159556 RepID=A0A1B5L5V2_USTVR|nr:hypothetical protein UVI_02059280 [Ustilaginoidea virens]